ncbi:MAG: hypothetical protein H6703_07850 [Myxococcales bacterium]|nr:hypothetical protein [Myxococcales bacterium]
MALGLPPAPSGGALPCRVAGRRLEPRDLRRRRRAVEVVRGDRQPPLGRRPVAEAGDRESRERERHLTAVRAGQRGLDLPPAHHDERGDVVDAVEERGEVVEDLDVVGPGGEARVEEAPRAPGLAELGGDAAGLGERVRAADRVDAAAAAERVGLRFERVGERAAVPGGAGGLDPGVAERRSPRSAWASASHASACAGSAAATSSAARQRRWPASSAPRRARSSTSAAAASAGRPASTSSETKRSSARPLVGAARSAASTASSSRPAARRIEARSRSISAGSPPAASRRS